MKTARLIVVIVAAILAIVVIAQNTESVETRFLFATVTMPRAILLVLTLLIGFVLGAVSAVWMRRSGAQS